jgi:hypothetical protein
LTGILYIHPQGDNLGSSTLKRNLRTLRVLLGAKYLERLTVLTVPASSATPSHEPVANLLQPASPFYELTGAKFRASTLDQSAAHRILLEYASLEPESFAAQTSILSHRIKDISVFVEDNLKRTENTSVTARVEMTRVQKDEGFRKFRVESTEWDSERKTLNEAIVESNAEAEKLRGELQQTRAEYVSLRSHLQVQENVEQSQIVQNLADLNRRIDDLGRAVSNYLVDVHAEAGATSLKASQLPELKAMFEHVQGKSSLVESSAGTGMSVPDFFDYAIRAILCEQLCKRIFKPFHPSIADPHAAGRFMQSVYQRIQRQGKSLALWRAGSC